jgi:purine-nucleoside phosphorylase
MTHTYTKALREKALRVASRLGTALQRGVYMYFPGPQYETPAEIRAARVLGADAVGMSTVPEVIAARHCGMEILGFSLISNLAAGMLDQPLSEEEVLEAAAAAKERFSALILGCLEAL